MLSHSTHLTWFVENQVLWEKKEIKSGNRLRKLFANNHATSHQKMWFFIDLISDLDLLLIRPLKRTKIFFFIFGLGSLIRVHIAYFPDWFLKYHLQIKWSNRSLIDSNFANSSGIDCSFEEPGIYVWSYNSICVSMISLFLHYFLKRN